ncbi:unnamed protein product, partial [Sphagnum jensenii]
YRLQKSWTPHPQDGSKAPTAYKQKSAEGGKNTHTHKDRQTEARKQKTESMKKHTHRKADRRKQGNRRPKA